MTRRNRDCCAADETFTGGLCLGAMEPKSNDIILEQAVHARDQGTWQALMEQALAGLNCQVIGDIPIFVALDSADVWVNPAEFFLDQACQPTVVAGVPPDYFSTTGQLWGNPLYRWEVMAANGYAWWRQRLKAALRLYDLVRIEHFCGFASYWEVPAGERTAVNGRWVQGPGAHFLTVLQHELGALPIIAEDLGEITPDVVALRNHFKFPGMNVLHFAFSTDANNPYLPHNATRNCVVNTGTHDNKTTMTFPQQRLCCHRAVNSTTSQRLPERFQ